MGMLPTSSLVIKSIVLFAAYLVTARIGLSLHPVNEFATLIWPPTGIALAALFLYGYRLWPAVALGAFIVNHLIGAPVPQALGIAAGNTLEAVIGAYLLKEFVRFKDPFGRLRDALYFSMVALATPTISATVGVFTLWVGGTIPSPELAITWLAWWTGDTLGALVFTPFLIQYLSRPPDLLRTGRAHHLYAMRHEGIFLLLTAVSYVVFWTDIFPMPYPLLVPFLFVVLCAGPRLTALASVFLAVLVILGTLSGYGPFALFPLPLSFFYMQLFLGTVIIVFSVTSSALWERRSALMTLEEKNAELEEALKKLAADNAAKNEFIAALSHELRNPLAPVVHALDRMRLETKLGPDETRQIIDGMSAHVRTIVRLLDDLLDISRITRRKIRLRTENIALQSAVHQAVETVQPLIDARHHTLLLSMPANPCIVHADPTRLQQILVNILNNAARYTPPHGKIDLSVEAREGECRVSVRDNGSGVDPAMLEAIFKPFVQIAHIKNDNSSEGLGIGLALTKQLVELHGGRIWAESGGAGRGSEIIFVLPTAEKIPASE